MIDKSTPDKIIMLDEEIRERVIDSFHVEKLGGNFEVITDQ